jgi:hypothetical protein
MVSGHDADELPYAMPPYMIPKSSAEHRTDRSLPAAEYEQFVSHEQEIREAEPLYEARKNGTYGNVVILPFAAAAGHENHHALRAESNLHPVPAATNGAKPRGKTTASQKEKKPEPLMGTGTKPPRVGVNIEWVQKGVGWDCREVYYVGKQRRRRHLGHIGKQKWEEMQQEHVGKALEEVLREWIEARRAEKSMSLGGE